jgi:hypothetical protein
MPLSQVSEGWANQQVPRCQRDGEAVCIKVNINSGSLKMLLATKGCRNIGVPGTRRTTDE